jgi:hypothetical protein
LTRKKALLDLSKIFAKHLISYAGLLVARLPRLATTYKIDNLSYHEHTVLREVDTRHPLQESSEILTCKIVNTSEHCYTTIAQVSSCEWNEKKLFRHFLSLSVFSWKSELKVTLIHP